MRLFVMMALVLVSFGCVDTGEDGDCIVQCSYNVARDRETNREFCTSFITRTYMCEDWRIFYCEGGE